MTATHFMMGDVDEAVRAARRAHLAEAEERQRQQLEHEKRATPAWMAAAWLEDLAGPERVPELAAVLRSASLRDILKALADRSADPSKIKV